MNSLLYNLMRLLVGILFWLREFTPPFVFAPGRFNGTEVGGGAAGAGEPGADGEIDWSSLREKEQVEPDESSPLGLYVTLQSWVMVALFMRALFFFRGFRSFATLFNIAVETTRAVMPFSSSSRSSRLGSRSAPTCCCSAPSSGATRITTTR